MTYTESARAQLDALQVKDHVRILALETSCDETAAAIIEDGRTIVSNIVFSQIDLHALYGGPGNRQPCARRSLRPRD